MRGAMVMHLFDSSSGLFLDGINLTHHAVHSSVLAAASEAPAPHPITVSCLFRLINWLDETMGFRVLI